MILIYNILIDNIFVATTEIITIMNKSLIYNDL